MKWTRSRPLARPSRAFGFAQFLSPLPKRFKSCQTLRLGVLALKPLKKCRFHAFPVVGRVSRLRNGVPGRFSPFPARWTAFPVVGRLSRMVGRGSRPFCRRSRSNYQTSRFGICHPVPITKPPGLASGVPGRLHTVPVSPDDVPAWLDAVPAQNDRLSRFANAVPAWPEMVPGRIFRNSRSSVAVPGCIASVAVVPNAGIEVSNFNRFRSRPDNGRNLPRPAG